MRELIIRYGGIRNKDTVNPGMSKQRWKSGGYDSHTNMASKSHTDRASRRSGGYEGHTDTASTHTDTASRRSGGYEGCTDTASTHRQGLEEEEWRL